MSFADIKDLWSISRVSGTGPGKFSTAGDVISGLFNITFYLATFLAFFWIVWAAFQYIAAGGDKQKLAQARSRITWALVGLLIIALAFLIAKYIAEILKPVGTIIPL